MIYGYINNSIETELSHIQIHNPKYLDDYDAIYTIDENSISSVLENNSDISAYSFRGVVSGMISSGRSSKGVQIKSIQPEQEKLVTNLSDFLIDGEYLSGSKNPVIISQKLAEELKVKLRSKVVLTFQGIDREITSTAVRVNGIFKTNSSMFDERFIFVNKDKFGQIVGEDFVQEVGILVENIDEADTISYQLNNAMSEQSLARSYSQISPEVQLFQSQIKISAYIFITIIMLALIFGIINTMLMAVLERQREIGMLMAIGMNKLKVFTLIVFETLMLSLIAIPIGLGLGYFTVKLLSNTGIDLSKYSKGISEFGIAEIIYPQIEYSLMWELSIAVGITAFIGALYPAWKAINLNPIEAIRTL
jgi:ABC-type lipoprotein release transport system permease subunit